MSLLRAGDVFVHPSLSEGVPKAVIEAMAAGVAVVATDVGAVADVLGHGERGVLVPPGQPARLAAAAAALLDESAVRTAIRDRALDWAADHTIDHQANRLVEHLRRKLPLLAWPDERQ